MPFDRAMKDDLTNMVGSIRAQLIEGFVALGEDIEALSEQIDELYQRVEELESGHGAAMPPLVSMSRGGGMSREGGGGGGGSSLPPIRGALPMPVLKRGKVRTKPLPARRLRSRLKRQAMNTRPPWRP